MTKNRILAEMANRGYVPGPSRLTCIGCALRAQPYFECAQHPVARDMLQMTSGQFWCAEALRGTLGVWVQVPTHELPSE